MGASEMPPHVSIVFKELFDELKSMKQQQWTITNYCVLLLAAIYTVKLPYVSHGPSLLKGMAVATAVIGSALLLRIQCNMARPRLRLDKLQKTYFTEVELRGIGLTDEEINNLGNETCSHKLTQCFRGWEFSGALIGVLVIGALLVYSAL